MVLASSRSQASLELPARGRVVVAVELDVEHLALAHAREAVDGQALERALDRLALRIEHAGLQGHDHARFHGERLPAGQAAFEVGAMVRSA